jgi:hypothetical protein
MRFIANLTLREILQIIATTLQQMFSIQITQKTLVT